MATIINGDGIVTAEGTSSTQGRLRLAEDTDNGTNYVELQAPASVASNVTFTLPSADGTNGQVLQTNGSGTLSFTNPTSLASPLAVTGNSTAGAEIRLPEDTDNGSNYVALKAADNIASNVTFTLPSADGTSGQVLQTNGSGTLSFATPAAGALVYLSATTASAVSSVDIETGISSTYDDYIILCDNLTQPSASNTYFYIQYKVGGTYRTSSYKYQLEYTDTAIASQYNEVASTTPFTSGVKVAAYAYAANAGTFFNVQMTLRSVNTAGSYPIVCTQVTGYSATDRGRDNNSYGLTEAATGTLSGIRFLTASGTISGVFKLYGIAKS